MKLEHIGIAVKSLEDSIPAFEKIFGEKATETEHVEEQKVNVRKFHLENCDIEILEGTAPDSPVSKFIEKRGEGIHHLSFEVEDLARSLKEAKESGIRLIDEEPKTGSDDMLIAFLHPKSTAGILMELCEKKKEF
jgi:methylmalonyl-CoA/ethylmalonyl-CoA epimerase